MAKKYASFYPPAAYPFKPAEKNAKTPEPEHDPIFYGEDNSYCYAERRQHIENTLRKRYGDVIKSAALRMELQLPLQKTSEWCYKTGLNNVRVCMGTFKVEDVAQRVVDYL